MRPRLLDLFCGAGGAAKGYADAGFEVVGVDVKYQPHYPFRFWQEDATDTLDALAMGRGLFGKWGQEYVDQFDVIHASPPCQVFTAYRRRGGGVGWGYPNLIAELRAALRRTKRPYVIENVPSAPLENPVQLCGSSFGLDVRRHRLFECSFPVMAPPCNHSWQTPRFPAATNRAKDSRRTVEIGVWRIPLKVQQQAMGIDWMTLQELSEAIPPAYTEFIGHQLMAAINCNKQEAAA